MFYEWSIHESGEKAPNPNLSRPSQIYTLHINSRKVVKRLDAKLIKCQKFLILSWGGGRVVWNMSTIKIAFKWYIMQPATVGRVTCSQTKGLKSTSSLSYLPSQLERTEQRRRCELSSARTGTKSEEFLDTNAGHGANVFCFLIILI